MITKKELQEITRKKLLKTYTKDPKNNVELYYNEILEDMYDEARFGYTDYRLFKEDYDEITWFSLLRLFLLDGYNITYYNPETTSIKGFDRDDEIQEATFENASMVSIGWEK